MTRSNFLQTLFKREIILLGIHFSLIRSFWCQRITKRRWQKMNLNSKTLLFVQHVAGGLIFNHFAEIKTNEVKLWVWLQVQRNFVYLILFLSLFVCEIVRLIIILICRFCLALNLFRRFWVISCLGENKSKIRKTKMF